MAIKGSCHCGRTKFEATEAPASVTRCTCSFCSKRGALWAYYAPEQVSIVTDGDDAVYRWRSRTVAHHFCPHCGCTTYSVAPDWSKTPPDFEHPRISLNARLFDDVDVDAIAVTVIDGKNLW